MKTIYRYPLFVICFLMTITGSSQVNFKCGTHGLSTPSNRSQQRAPSELSDETFGLMVKHHIYRNVDGSQAVNQEQLDVIMDSVNRFFQPAKIRFFTCGNAEIKQLGEDDLEDIYGHLFIGIMSEENVPGTINVYWPSKVRDTHLDDSGHPVGGQEVQGFTLKNHDSSIKGIAINRARCLETAGRIEHVALIHELGHYLTLHHTFRDPDDPGEFELVTREESEGANCASTADELCDTPADPNAFGSNCSIEVDVLDEQGKVYKPNAKNFMCYSICQSEFSPKQIEKMRYYVQDEVNYELSDYILSLKSAGDDLNNVTRTYTAPYMNASNKVTGTSDVKYNALAEIVLKPGFKAAKNTKFNARLGMSCDDDWFDPGFTNSEMTSVAEKKNIVSKLEVFPNPFQSVVNVVFSLEKKSNVLLTVQNLYGQKLLSETDLQASDDGTYKKQLSMAELPAGVYFIVLKTEQGSFVKKLIKSN